MLISFIGIRNFRKLNDVKIDFSNDTTLFVGANNSGKTSAMDALRKFLIKGDCNNFVYNDLTVTKRKPINEIGTMWVAKDAKKPIDLSAWINIVPTMDIWLEVENNEFHYVSNIIPTLEWEGGKLGVRLCFLPKDIGKLFDDYLNAYSQSRDTERSDKNTNGVKLFPQNLCEFVERYLIQYFEIKSFILDPKKINQVQITDFGCECEEKNPFIGLVKIDMIYAQRGLSDADSSNDSISLSHQLRTYYDKHLDVEKSTSPEDLITLSALQKAHETFDVNLATKFKPSFEELAKLGFPSITDPKITIESKFKEKTAFEHDSAVQYALTDEDVSLRLPEKYNGLGYQNLISIAFKLMSFRDGRIHKGKAASDENFDKIAPLHLVLLEEPEAHLHVQVQQVLIKKAYEILTDNNVLISNNFKTQLVVSSHSSHIANEVPFKKIRYFKRCSISKQLPIPTSMVVNLTNTFGADPKTEKFVERYLRVTHCDLFFADAVIFVEGTSETVLVPHFIKNSFPELDSRYITILPVGGSFSHKFKPLIEKLGITTLVITDLDPVSKSVKPDKNGVNRTTYNHAFPERKIKQISGNPSIKGWGIQQNEQDQLDLDYLLNLSNENKIFKEPLLRIAYQTPMSITLNDSSKEAISATFEDSLIYENLSALLASLHEPPSNNRLLDKIKITANNATVDEFCRDVYSTIHNDSSGKVSLALNLMFELETIEVPQYIKEGLEWLQNQLRKSKVKSITEEVEND